MMAAESIAGIMRLAKSSKGIAIPSNTFPYVVLAMIETHWYLKYPGQCLEMARELPYFS